MPTIHPAALMRQAKLTSAVVSDLRKSIVIPPENYNLAPTEQDVLNFTSTKFAFDFEWDSQGNITLCGLSDRFYSALVVPFRDPYIDLLRRIFESATELIGHNIINADMDHIERLGWKLRDDLIVHDTMLKQHLVQPDFPHDLGFVASIFTNKVFWKGKGWEEEDEDGLVTESKQQWRTWDKSDALPRSLGGYSGCSNGTEAFALYNARDTDAEFQINTPISNLLAKYNLQHVYEHVSTPIAFICRDICSKGIKLDLSELGTIRSKLDTDINELESRLPNGLAPFEEEKRCNLPAPPGTYRPVTKSCSGKGSTKHEKSTVVFDSPSNKPCPTCGRLIASGKMSLAKIIKGTKRVKETPYTSAVQVQKYIDSLKASPVYNSKTGRRTTGKKAQQIWAKDHPEFITVQALKELITLRNNFAKDTLIGNVEKGIPQQERMYFNLKVHGTSEGRLSSTGQRSGIDLNIQNQPEDFRVVFVPDNEGDAIINLDIVQGENWLTAWIAQDWDRWEKLQDPSYDEHSELAQRIFNTPVSKALAKGDKYIASLRQLGKKINHGRNYGMGVRKQLEELQAEGFDQFQTHDVKEFIEIWKVLNKGTVAWQDRVIAEVQATNCLTNPFGRKRWFTTRDQATKALAFLPASTLADMVLRMMIAHYPDVPRIARSIEANQLDVFFPIVPSWRLAIQVHDSLVLMGPDEGWREQAERTKLIMTQPWPQLNGFKFKVEIKYSDKNWGSCSTVEI